MAQAAGGDFQSAGPAEWTERTLAMAQKLTAAQAARYWQILLSGFNDLQTAPDTATALNMILLRLAAAANLPSPEEAARMVAEKGTPPGKPDANGMAPSPAGGLESFAEIVACLTELREINLQVELERYVRPGPVRSGYFSCQLEETAPGDLLARLKSFLERESGEDWVVEQIRTGAETIRQTEIRTREEKFAAAAAHPAVADALKSIPGTTIVDVTEPLPAGDNVIDLNSRRSA